MGYIPNPDKPEPKSCRFAQDFVIKCLSTGGSSKAGGAMAACLIPGIRRDKIPCTCGHKNAAYTASWHTGWNLGQPVQEFTADGLRQLGVRWKKVPKLYKVKLIIVKPHCL